MSSDPPVESPPSLDERLGRSLSVWIELVTRAPRRTLLLVAALTVAVGSYTVAKLGVDTDPAELFAPELPFRRHLADFEQAFPQFQDTLVILLEGDDAGVVERSTAELAARLRQEPERFRSVYWPQGEPFFANHALLYLPVDELRETTTRLVQMAPLLRHLERSPSLDRLADTLGRALRLAGARPPEPLVAIAGGLANAIDAALRGEVAEFAWRGTLAGEPASAARQIVVAQPSRDYSTFMPSGPAIEWLRTLAGELDLAGRGVRIRLTGDVALGHDELEEASGGAAIAGVLSLFLVTGFLWLGLWSKRLVTASLITLLVGLIWTAGWATLAVGHLNLISVAFAVLYISLGVDFSIHLCLRVSELRSHGLGVVAGLELAARDVGGSLLLAALTTALGFFAFVPTAFTGVAELGVIAGCGVLISLVANATVLPALLCLMWQRTTTAEVEGLDPPGVRLLERLRGRARAVRRTALALGALAIVAVPWAGFDANPLHLRDPDVESVQAFQDLASDPQTTPYGISVLAKDAARAERIADAVEVLESVAGTARLRDFVPAEQADKLTILRTARTALAEAPAVEPSEAAPGDAAEALAALHEVLARLPEDAAAPLRELGARLAELLATLEGARGEHRAALLTRLEAGAVGGLPANLARLRAALGTEGFAAEDLPAAVRERWIAPDGRRRVEVLPRGDLTTSDALQRFTEAVLAIEPRATGGPVVVTESARVAVASFRTAFAYALSAMTIALLVILRRARDVMLVLIPLTLAGLLTVAVMAVSGSAFNFANIIGLPLLLGMGVDNGIHTVHRFRLEEAAGGDILHTSTTRAVLFSSLTTLGGFGTLIVSPHPGTASLGFLLCVGIVANLVCTLVVLPALLTLAGMRRGRLGAEPDRASGDGL